MLSNIRTEEIGLCVDCQQIATCQWFRGLRLCISCLQKRAYSLVRRTNLPDTEEPEIDWWGE